MADKRLINPVTDTMDKQRTYREQMGRYKQAMQYGFYLQAVMIDYAVIEDRLRSILYHMAFLSNRTSMRIWKKTRPYLVEIVALYMSDGKAIQLGIHNISDKIRLVQCVMRWTQEENAAHGDKFLTALKRQCESLDTDGILSMLDAITEWCGYRNELVHGLMNKNLDSLNEKLQLYAERGMDLARNLDNEIRQLKKGNKIRRSMNLPMN